MIKKVYNCKVCEYKSPYASSIRSHNAVHNGKNYSCNICFSKFSLPQSLKKHMNSIHNRISFKCEQKNPCDFTTSERSNIKKHVCWKYECKFTSCTFKSSIQR